MLAPWCSCTESAKFRRRGPRDRRAQGSSDDGLRLPGRPSGSTAPLAGSGTWALSSGATRRGHQRRLRYEVANSRALAGVCSELSADRRPGQFQGTPQRGRLRGRDKEPCSTGQQDHRHLVRPGNDAHAAATLAARRPAADAESHRLLEGGGQVALGAVPEHPGLPETGWLEWEAALHDLSRKLGRHQVQLDGHRQAAGGWRCTCSG
mmetsp:Transcript_25367/g.60351  ORF Transcript_25367/g.60351 Transcript_25367/m.60351 type:complete len:207 (-) Transcript_25367:522-1142(-)